MENEKRKPKSADGVRIIGAKEAGGAVDDQTRSFGPAAAGPGGDDERDWEGDDGAWMTADPDEASEAPDASSSEFSAPLPHWADRPEPRGTEGGGEDTAAWTSFAGQGPRWRDQPGDWGDAHVGDPSVLADESVRVGALDPNRRGTADQMRFDDEDLKPAGEGRGAPAASVPVDDGLESVSLPR